jgi:hypothetical protein
LFRRTSRSDVAARVRAFSKQSPCQYGPRHAAYDLKKLRGKCLPGMRYRWVANGARKGPRRVLMETPVARLVFALTMHPRAAIAQHWRKS